MGPPQQVAIHSRVDVERARLETRVMAEKLGFDREAAERVVLAAMELASNLLHHAVDGEIALTPVTESRGIGIRLESRDRGPGISDIERALTDGFSTGGGLGSGLPAVLRLMDSFTIESSVAGTRIMACAWPTSR